MLLHHHHPRTQLQRAKSSHLQPTHPQLHPPSSLHHALHPRPFFHSPTSFPPRQRFCSPKHHRKDTETAESSLSFSQPSPDQPTIQQYRRMVQILQQQSRNLTQQKSFLLNQQKQLDRQNAQLQQAILAWQSKLNKIRQPKRKIQQIDIDNELEQYIHRTLGKESAGSTWEGFRK